MVPLFPDSYEKIRISKSFNANLHEYDKLVFGTSTWGRGIPPRPFFDIRDTLGALSGKTIGLYGSGRTEFRYFCGAVDLLEQILSPKNKIAFKFKYEGYPRERDFETMKGLIERFTNENS